MMKKLSLPPCDLGEGPLWHEETQDFVFADITKGRLFAAAPSGEVHLLLQTDWQLGAFLFDTAGNLILFTEQGVFALPYGGTPTDCRLLWEIPMQAGERFNDAICDPAGRMLAGTKTADNRNGSLWLFDKNLQPMRLLQGLQISNGMGFAEHGTVFYHTDSGQRTIYRYHYNAAQGTFADPRAFFTLQTPDNAVPDGMTVDKRGQVWTACWGGNCLRCLNTDGQETAKISLPATQVSSLTFGGPDLQKILITSAACGCPGADEGGIWILDAPCPGVAESRAVL